MRLVWPKDTDYVLNGEIDKRGHPIIKRLGADLTTPDLLVHVPGYMGKNLAILEVKPGHATAKGVLKDLRTLSVFQSVVEYERGVYLFYGDYPKSMVRALRSHAFWRRRSAWTGSPSTPSAPASS